MFKDSRLLPSLAAAILTAPLVHAQWPASPRADLVIGNRATVDNSVDGTAGLAIDEAHGKIYVSSATKHRILRFSLPAVLQGGDTFFRAEAVLGQSDFYGDTFSTGANRLSNPGALAVDAVGTLWVADRGNGRVLRFEAAYAKTNGASADGVLGRGDFNNGAGQFSIGSGLNGLAADDFGNLFVSISTRNAVYRFNNARNKANGAMPDSVFGQKDFTDTASGTSATQLNKPWGIWTANSGSTTLWVVDRGNNRLLRYDNANFASPLPNATTGLTAGGVLGQPDFVTGAAGSAMSRFDDPQDVLVLGSSLFVTDPGNYRTVRFPSSSPALNASAVTTLRHPGGIAGAHGQLARILAGERLFAVGNSIERFDGTGSKTGTVLPDATFGTGTSPILDPSDVAIDPTTGKVFVADKNYSSGGVARFANYSALVNGAQPEAWVCQMQSVAAVDYGGGLVHPYGLSIDAQGRLWVADPSSRAVYRYDNAATMGEYTPHSAFLGGTPGTAANQMTGPRDVYADPQGRVWVVDTDNHRVLRFDAAASKANGAAANAVLGQTAFGLKVQGSPPTLSNMNYPQGIVGNANGTIWVSDTGNHRVLRFDTAASKPNGGTANAVLGQPNGTTGTGSVGANGLDTPIQLAVESGLHLWVAEQGNKRYVRFKNAASLATGAAADAVVGQPDFFHTNFKNDYEHVQLPGGMALDPGGRLYVADIDSGRVMRFSPLSVQIKSIGQSAQKAFTMTYTSVAGVPYDIESSPDLAIWSYEGTQVAGGALTTWTASQAIGGRRFYRVKMK